ncbi:MAG TPA: DegV family protein [Candidatus Baltobacteraceae bacterium]|nr:DegV family protein [Candidatus Baltobacteraceae bacterium]
MSIAIVTDSTSDILPERAAALGISVVPLFVIFGERSFRDQVDLSRAEFFEKLASEKTLPITSQPTAQMFEDAFAPLVEAGHDILCITISSALSGTINAARAAAQHFPGKTIEIYDSQTAAGGLGMMVLRAREAVAGGASMSEVMRALDRERETQTLQACIADLSHIQRTGRIGKAQAVLGTLMKIVPILALKDGQVVPAAQVRTFSRAQETMIDLALKAVTDVSKARFVVMHTNAPQLAQNAIAKLEARFGGMRPQMIESLEAGPAIAVHAGPGAVGIFTAQDE